MATQPVSTTAFNESGVTAYYAADLPDTTASIPIEYFRGKQNVYGQYAIVREMGDGSFEGVRDPMGIGKMFYTEDQKGALHFSGEFRDLLSFGTPVFALPRGQHVRLAGSRVRQLIGTVASIPSNVPETVNDQLTTPEAFHDSAEGKHFKEALANRMDVAFSVIKRLEEEGFQVYIALSGGLDSSIIAALARRHLRNPVACTLDLGRSEDAEKSALITRVLDIEQVLFETNDAEILTAVDESPVLCQDYRDFNVHCTALNVLLAKNIRKLADERGAQPGKAVVLTGDTMNELTCDYHAEEVDGTLYYRLPRVGPKMLQSMLTGGLDTSDREVLPFRTYGLSCIQPYAIAYDLYLALPEPLFKIEDVKRILNGHLVPLPVLELLPESKIRAQVGSKESMGVLGLCHHRGIDESFFLKKLLGTESPEKKHVPITMGRYETESFSH